METSDRAVILDSMESQTSDDTEDGHEMRVQPCYLWKLINVHVNVLVQTLIGANVSVCLWFAFKSTPISAFQLHVGLCVIGYQLLMAHGVLCLRSPGWSSLSVKHRRRVHWILQLGGSILAIVGSALMIKEKTDAGRPHFTSLHAKLALAALVFTCASLINGVLSFYATELRHYIPSKLSKISHIVLGATAFVTSSASLAYGFNKHSFVEWASQEFAYVMVGIVVVYTTLIVALPLFKALRRVGFWKIKIC